MEQNLVLRFNLPGVGEIQHITDLRFADDIALLSEEIAQAQELLSRVEMEASKIGLHINAKKWPFNYEDESQSLQSKAAK